MKVLCKKICVLVLTFTIMVTSTVPILAQQETNYVYKEQKTDYLEGQYAISLDGVEFYQNDKTGKVEVGIETGISWTKKYKAEKSKDRIDFLINRYDTSLSEILFEDDTEGSLVGISYTECPLVEDTNGNLVRIESYEKDNENIIKEASASYSETGDEKEKYYFSLFTKVMRNETKDSKGRYKYTCKTYGVWSKNSALSGKKYPAPGDDYMIQAVPNSFTRNSDSFNLIYNTGKDAKEGVHYSLCDGGSNYVEYSIVDDPFGLAQMEQGTITTVCYAKEDDDRTINSYYVHTWKAMDIDISFTVNSNKEVALNIDPENVDKSWKVYSYVTFDF